MPSSSDVGINCCSWLPRDLLLLRLLPILNHSITQVLFTMRPTLLFRLAVLSYFSVCGVASTPVLGQMNKVEADEAEPTVGFDQVQPILRKRCQNCHNPEELRGDFSVADMTAIKAGSSSGPVIVPFKPKESLLYTTTAHLDEPTMPPNSRKIPAREIAVIRKWIEGGLVMKSGDVAKSPEVATAPEVEPEMEVGDETAASNFQPVTSSLRPTAITAIAAHPKESMVALAGDQQVVIFDPAEATLSRAIRIAEEQITEIRYTADGASLLVACGTPGLSGSVYTFDSQSGEQLSKVADENDSILALGVSPDLETLAIGGPTKLLKIIDADGEVRHTLRKHTDWVLAAAFSPDGLLCASADRFGGLFVWETQSGELFHALRGHQGPVHSLAWDADGETLLSGGEDGVVRVWNMHHGELTAQWDAGVGAILGLDRASGMTLVAGRNGKAMAYRVPEEAAGEFEIEEQIDCVQICESANRAVASDASGRIYVLSLPELEALATIELPIRQDGIPQLLAKLEKENGEFESRQMAARAEQMAMAAEQERIVANAETQQSENQVDVLPVGGDSVAGVVALLQSEVTNAKSELEQQLQIRDSMQNQLRQLETQLATQESLIGASQQRISRVTKVLQAITDSPSLQAAYLKSLETQHAEQVAILEAAEALQTRAKSAADKPLLPTEVNWRPALSKLNELSAVLQSQARRTEKAIEALKGPTKIASIDSRDSSTREMEDSSQ
ncbi:MAG: c-type cytochrome domain-containing protein [Aureliella sp.]